jgi:hypothetical protein
MRVNALWRKSGAGLSHLIPHFAALMRAARWLRALAQAKRFVRAGSGELPPDASGSWE